MNPYEPPETNARRSTSLKGEGRSESYVFPVVLSIFAVLAKVGLIASIVLLYWMGGRVAVWTIFVGVPLALVIGFLLLMVYAHFREPAWKAERHTYLREKRRKRLEESQNGRAP